MMKNRCLLLDAQHNLQIVEHEAPHADPGNVVVKIAANGICGSDVHFFKEGRLGNFVVTTPYIPGHEASGEIIETGSGIGKEMLGKRVAIEPGIPCGECRLCRSGRYNLCKDVVFLSAPPIDGTFCDYIEVRASAVHVIPDSLSMEHAALVEPAAVAVHAVNRGSFSNGSSGVIVGAGPIGLMTLQAFKATGGGETTVIDVVDERLEMAKQLGADHTLNPRKVKELPQDIADVAFETAGNDTTTTMLLSLVKPAGQAVQVGWPRSTRVPVDVALLMDKEINYVGVNRYANAFPAALQYLCDGRINGTQMISHTFTLDQAPKAFEYARDYPQKVIKVLVKN